VKVPAFLLATLLSCAALAHEHGEQWTLANEYPATTLSGEGDEHFAVLVKDATEGRISIVTMPDGTLFKSREQLLAVATDKSAMADIFGGVLGEAEPVFEFASLPFLSTSIRDARTNYEAARPSYEAAFARHNQKLLYATPWPPSGLWTRDALDSPAAIARLKVRTYDKAGTQVFSRLGAKAMQLSYSEVLPRLASGEIDAVVSSGDGATSKTYAQYLKRFNVITYAIPLSFTTVNLDRWKALDERTREAIEHAAATTEARVWKALEQRLEMNYRNLRALGVTIVTDVDPALRQRLREEARLSAIDWAERVGPESREILERR
jgi:TRAP-type C4-dicarboxylate transport system substrate-binding protein